MFTLQESLRDKRDVFLGGLQQVAEFAIAGLDAVTDDPIGRIAKPVEEFRRIAASLGGSKILSTIWLAGNALSRFRIDDSRARRSSTTNAPVVSRSITTGTRKLGSMNESVAL